MLQIANKFYVIQVPTAIGSEAGKRALEEAVNVLGNSDIKDNGALVAFDVREATLATTSFMKGSVLVMFQSGRLFTDLSASTVADAFGVPALNVFPVIANANPDVEELADEIFARRNFPLLSVRLDKNGMIDGGRMVGFLDEALLRTMRAWEGAQPFTAANLRELFPEEGISQTAWSNRLNDLWRLRLLRRSRQGKSWIYQPVAEGVNYG